MIALYTRVSTQEQATEGYSIKEQEERLIKYCEIMNWKDYHVYSDPAYSGASLDRPSLQKLISDVESGIIKKVIVLKLDRLSRSQLDTLYLIEKVFCENGCDFISITENFDTSTAFGKAMIGMLAVFAQLEREQIRERMSVGKEARIKEGKWYGGRPAIGYSYENGSLKVEPFEAMQIKEIYQSFLSGKSKYEILKELRNKGYYHKYGKWNRTSLDRVLENNLYIGQLKLNGKEIKGIHEPIISEEDFFNVQNILSQREKTERVISESYLGGLLWCKKCGSRIGICIGGKKPDYFRYYKCYNKISRNRFTDTPPCNNKNYRMEILDDLIFGEIRKLNLDPEKMEEPAQKNTNQAELIEKEIKRIDSQRSKLIDLYSFGDFSAEELEQKINPLTERKKQLSENLRTIQTQQDSTIKKREMIRSFDDLLKRADHSQIRLIIETLIEKIEIDGDDIIIHWNF